MTAYTQKYMAKVMAPWLNAPQVQFATFTFDDATPAQFPTAATIRTELARRSAFKDADATTTGDTWAASGKEANLQSLEVEKLDILYLAELNPYQSLAGVSPPDLSRDFAYVWPAVGTSGLDTNLAGLTICTVAGDDVLTGNIADADDTPPVAASIPDAAALAGGAKAVQIGDALVAVVNNVEVLNSVFKDGTAVIDLPAVDFATSGADVYTVDFFIRKANGATSRVLRRTQTNS